MSSTQLQVGIIGAGIAGLAAAIAASRAGHSVQIFEKSHFKNEVGAAMTICPNGANVLERWKFDFEKAGAVDNRQYRMSKGETLEPFYRESFEDVQETYGHRFCFVHRVDFHETLRDQARALGPTVTLGVEVVNLDCDQGTLTLADGSTYQKDLIIIANGTHCRFVSSVAGIDVPITNPHMGAYRCLVPMEKIMANPVTAEFFKNEPAGMMCGILTSGAILQSQAVYVTYPCRSSTILNIAILYRTKEGEEEDQSWNNFIPTSSVLEALRDFHPAWRALIEVAGDECKAYTLKDHPPVPSMHRGKSILIGEAAHPMMPTMAQGGSMCIEDAGALEILLAGATKENLESRLAMFSRLRVPRCATIQLLSSKRQEPRPVLEKQIRNFYSGRLPPVDAKPYSRPLRDFFFDYDIFMEAQRVLEGSSEPVFFSSTEDDGVVKSLN